MTNQRLLRSFLAVLLVIAIVLPGVAAAHYRGAIDWYFGPRISDEPHKPGAGAVNMFYYPWGTDKRTIDDHHETHWRTKRPRTTWDTDSEISDAVSNICKGDAFLGFDINGGGQSSIPQTFQSVGFEQQEGDCTDRFHTRLWDDTEHTDVAAVPHTAGYERWVVGEVHHEELVIPVRCTRPGFFPRCRFGSAHAQDVSPDAVEYTFYTVMGRERPGHGDHDGIVGGHCREYKWRKMVGSITNSYGFTTDGRVTRISMNHCSVDSNTR